MTDPVQQAKSPPLVTTETKVIEGETRGTPQPLPGGFCAIRFDSRFREEVRGYEKSQKTNFGFKKKITGEDHRRVDINSATLLCGGVEVDSAETGRTYSGRTIESRVGQKEEQRAQKIANVSGKVASIVAVNAGGIEGGLIGGAAVGALEKKTHFAENGGKALVTNALKVYHKIFPPKAKNAVTVETPRELTPDERPVITETKSTIAFGESGESPQVDKR